MRVRVASTALGITAALLALPACSTHTTAAKPRTPTRTLTRAGKPAGTAQNAAALSSDSLKRRLLGQSDLGGGYLRKPEQPTPHDDVTVVGCPALNKLGGDAATGGSLAFPHKAKAAFTHTGTSGSEVSEELYSDTANKLSDGTGRIFHAMTGCPNYQIVAGGTTIDMASQELPPRSRLGDEQWSQLMTFSTGGQSTVVKQTAIRDGNLLLVLSGSPTLVDRHLDLALTKATTTS